ncbi:MAG: hypothetical protein LBE02_07955 [Spirochaetaceae bacterium]|jgi:hypothetical protein|nr:hypothetical protein [Spirochaetaceae bacterium]
MFFLATLGKAEAQDWYRSNPSGMALERLPSSMVALHHEWALSVEKPAPETIPSFLRRYYASSYSVEQRMLYKRGALKRRQWIFRDRNGVTRINASLPADLAFMEAGETTDREAAEDGGSAAEGEIPPFVEVFASDRTLTEIHQYLVSGIHTTRYRYRENLLIRADAFLDATPLWTDRYRYTRSFLLRGVERTYHEGAAGFLAALENRPPAAPAPAGQAPAGQAPAERASANLPPPALDLRDSPLIPGFAGFSDPYDYSIMVNVLSEVYAIPAAKVIYDTDSRGRVLSETRYDEEGAVLSVINNEWLGDRISEIRWTAGSDQGRIVFFYSGEDRIGEEDYRNGILERKLSRQGEEEIEEIYMNGRAILRAVWREGRKISEERLR